MIKRNISISNNEFFWKWVFPIVSCNNLKHICFDDFTANVFIIYAENLRKDVKCIFFFFLCVCVCVCVCVCFNTNLLFIYACVNNFH